MSFRDRKENARIAAQYGVALTWDAAEGKAVPLSPEQAAKRVQNVTDQWGANPGDNGFMPGSAAAASGPIRQKFHPGRDILFGSRIAKVIDQCERLVSLGVPLKSHRTGLFLGDAGQEDLRMLSDLAEGKSRYKLGGFLTLLDTAPDLFVAQELVKATGEIYWEQYVELTCRRELSFTDYNTYLQVYAWDRMDHRGPFMSQPVNAADMDGYSFRRTDPVRQQVFGSLYHHRDSAHWTDLEMAIYAEARANGAPDISLMSSRIAEARKRMMVTENLLAYFGWTELGVPGAPIEGLLTHSQIDHNAAGAFGTDGPTDVAVLLDPIQANYVATKGIEAYDKIMVGPNVWAYLVTTDYKDTSSDSNETVAEVLMRKAAQFGIKDMVMVPECSFDSELETRLTDEHGISAGQAAIWAGGFESADCIALVNTKKEKGSVARGKDLAALPQEARNGSHFAQFFMSSGGFDVKQPKAFQILKDVTIA